MKLISLGREGFEEAYAIMEASFPSDEYRPRAEQLALLDDPRYTLLGCRAPDGALMAFLCVWRLEDFLFLEHFAVAEAHRNGGLGGKLLTMLKEWAGCPILLEAELPETPIACRRLGFYRRNGFFVNPYPYCQPPISAGKNPVPLTVLSSGGELSPTAFQKARACIYREVYRQSEE